LADSLRDEVNASGVRGTSIFPREHGDHVAARDLCGGGTSLSGAADPARQCDENWDAEIVFGSMTHCQKIGKELKFLDSL